MFSLTRGKLRSFAMALVGVGLVGLGAVTAAPPGYGPPPAAGCAPAGCCPAPCCATCGQPPDICTCTTFKPVCDTCYHTQPVVGYHNVCRTCYRQEPYCVTVPVTKVDCVTVDEGCYKMVWCPRVVTKQVPRVEYHQQVCTRTVPFTVSQCVPHVTNVVVPECRTRYVPQTQTFIKPPTPCCPPPCAPGCGAPYPMTQMAPAGMPQQPMVAAPMMPQQQQVAAPGMMPQQQAAPAVDPATLTPVPLITVPSVSADSPQTVASTNGAITNPYLRARSAANVWQTNRGMAAQ